VTTHSNNFLSLTDVQTHTASQMNMPTWTAIVVDPLRSLAKQKPELTCFRVFPPSYDGSWNVAPDGTGVIDKDSTIARWGAAYNRYYVLQSDYFMCSLGKKFVDIMSSNNLWIRALSSSSVMEPENRERFSERVRKGSEQLDHGSHRMAGGGGFGGFPGHFRKRGGGTGNKTLDQGTKAMCELAVEQCNGHVSQIGKDLIFNQAFLEGQRKEKEHKSKS